MNSKILSRILIASALCLSPIAAGAAITGCVGPITPVQVATTVETTAQIAISAAQTTWNFILPSLPAASQVADNALFTKGLAAANDALGVLNAAIVAYQNATGPAPNWSALIATLSTAVNDVVAIIDQFKTSTTPASGALAAAAPIPGYASLVQAAADLNRAAGHSVPSRSTR
jgi:hypothetical protein